MDCEYNPLPLEKSRLDTFKSLLKQKGLRGYSVTMPHKQNIIPYLDELTERANVMQSVNHVYQNRDKWIGDSVDGAGILGAAAAIGISLQRRNALILGCGGAARSAAYYLGQMAERVTILGRNAGKAKKTAEQIRSHVKCRMDFHVMPSLHEISPEYDFIVNTTPLGMKGYDKFQSFSWIEQLKKNTIICDLVYEPSETDLLACARKHGLKTITGIEVLIHQAYAQFFNWTGTAVDEEADTAVRNVLSERVKK